MSRAALAALVAAFLVLETALRFIGYSAPQWYERDPQLGWRLHPHRHGWFVADGKRVPVHTTPSGFRDREHTLDKPEGVYRIAVLGDENSEAMALELTQTWWWQLPARLQECGFHAARVAVGGLLLRAARGEQRSGEQHNGFCHGLLLAHQDQA